ncbi:putative aminotransferase [Besnoitia besnoiti]|uniref:Putative aminotransferase n=1 Tax=Besnoitia besnoiti TaxID=94643 RepID=A0A2A9MML3_BESBE|nr:putative aminotransferase [Besnoitia besnoiti]PFH37681.1 putative aminotransferase [Besnoitia besnoiti]
MADVSAIASHSQQQFKGSLAESSIPPTRSCSRTPATMSPPPETKTCGTVSGGCPDGLVKDEHIDGRGSIEEKEAENGGRRSPQPTLTLLSLSKRIVDCKYAVRGPIVRRALQLQKGLKTEPNSFPFKKLIHVNTGDPQGLGQLPISYYRKVMACVMYPPLMGVPLGYNHLAANESEPDVTESLSAEERGIAAAASPWFPDDVMEKSWRYMRAMGSIGAYTHSQGLPLFRQDIAAWMERRDGIPTNPDNIFLTDGASSAIRLALELLLRQTNDGVLIPVPQYPLYAGLVIRMGGLALPYFLEEETGWSLSIQSIEEAMENAKDRGICVRGLVLINPGNPTGTVLTEEEIRQVIDLCRRERLVLLADEVYQDNVYCGLPFISVRKVLHQMEASVSVFSFHSSSKGLVGECGLRGGMVHVDTVDEDVRMEMYKLVSMFMCGNTLGQLAMACICSPPKPGDASYEQFQRERQAIYNSMKTKAKLVHDELNKIDGVCCQPIAGSVFGFPQFVMPPGAFREATRQRVEPDLLFCLELLEATGIVTVPGSGFGQRRGTYHVRICILPEEHLLVDMLGKFRDFYKAFVKKYSE